jgi:hypothetical protein
MRGLDPRIHQSRESRSGWIAGTQASESDAVLRTAMPGDDIEWEVRFIQFT